MKLWKTFKSVIFKGSQSFCAFSYKGAMLYMRHKGKYLKSTQDEQKKVAPVKITTDKYPIH